MQESAPPLIFYTAVAEAGKLIFYVVLAVMVAVGFWRRRRGHADWANWIHTAIMLNFIVGVAYSGVRMITTDETRDMLVRRIFAWEAWFNLACAAFYFLIWWIWQEYKTLRRADKTQRTPVG